MSTGETSMPANYAGAYRPYIGSIDRVQVEGFRGWRPDHETLGPDPKPQTLNPYS